jgi:hypothetical protein
VTSFANSPYVSIGLAVLVVAFVCYRQLQTRSIREERGLFLYVIVFALGVLQTSTFLQSHRVGTTAIVLVCASVLVGIGLGALRGRLTHLWRADGQLFRRGNPWTIAIWIGGIGIHLGIDLYSGALDRSAKGFATSSLLLYVGLSLGMQRLVLLRRAKSIVEHPNEAPTAY